MERHANEALTDNSKIHYCRQCKDCAFWGNSDAFSNAYDKGNCDIYPRPGRKPDYVVENKGKCEHWTLRER